MASRITDLAQFQRGSQNPIDILVGQNVKHRRAQISMSQTALANKLGITFQQVQKYEKGSNRIGASRLYIISQLLNCAVGDLYDGIDDLGLETSDEDGNRSKAKRITDFISTSQGVSLCDAASQMDTTVRGQLVRLAVSIADNKA